jgi:hypothetical protein
VLICGYRLSTAAMQYHYSDGGDEGMREPLKIASFVLIGEKSVMALKPLISPTGDSIEFTVGGLYEQSARSKMPLLVPVMPVPPSWSGPFALRLENQAEPLMGPKVEWRPQ